MIKLVYLSLSDTHIHIWRRLNILCICVCVCMYLYVAACECVPSHKWFEQNKGQTWSLLTLFCLSWFNWMSLFAEAILNTAQQTNRTLCIKCFFFFSQSKFSWYYIFDILSATGGCCMCTINQARTQRALIPVDVAVFLNHCLLHYIHPFSNLERHFVWSTAKYNRLTLKFISVYICRNDRMTWVGSQRITFRAFLHCAQFLLKCICPMRRPNVSYQHVLTLSMKWIMYSWSCTAVAYGSPTHCYQSSLLKARTGWIVLELLQLSKANSSALSWLWVCSYVSPCAWFLCVFVYLLGIPVL